MAAPETLRVVVLVSGSGTLLQSLIDARMSRPGWRADIVAVGADRRSAHGLVRAEQAGIPTFVHRYAKGSDRAAWDAELTALVDQYHPDLVVSAGFMKLVGATFLDTYAGRMINTHPALSPSFPGMHAARDALAYGVKMTGATVFVVDDSVDGGAVLAQEPVRVHDDDTAESLHERIKIVERSLLVDIVDDFARARLALPYHRPPTTA